MSALLTFEGTPATMCVASGSHDPTPLRHVWHHVQPHEAGGPTVSSNLASLCDSCHYSIHRLLWYVRCQALGVPLYDNQLAALAHPPRRAQLALAQQGSRPELAHPARVAMLRERRRQVRAELGIPPDL